MDFININGGREQCVNLSYSVGIGGKNHKSDGRLIQFLFNFLYLGKQALIIHPPLMPLLPITGVFDGFTMQTILFFQASHRRHLLSADGVIHPASYENRVIKDISKPLMTITYLHLLAKRAQLKEGGNYLKGAKELLPELYF